jgi:hypothetical protein
METFPRNQRRGAAALLGTLIISCCVFISCNKVQANQATTQTPSQTTNQTANQGLANNAPGQTLSGPLKFIGSWGTRGSDPGQFQSPEWLAIDATGNVFVADAGAKAIEKFTFDGHPLMSFNDAQVAEPFRVAVDAGAGIYALSRNSNAFYIFSPEGEPFRHFPITPQKPEQRPVSIAVDSNGDIFIIVTTGRSPAGSRQAAMTDTKASAALLEQAGHHEIRQYNARGHYVRTMSTGGTAPGGNGPSTTGGNAAGGSANAANAGDKTFSPGSLGAGPDGNLYVLDVTGTRVEKFSDDGKMIAAWGGQPPLEGVPGDPISQGLGIAVTSKYVFTPEALNRGIRAWTINGDARIVDDLGGRLQSTNGEYQLAVNQSKGELVVLDMAGAKIYRFHIDF